LHSITYIPTKAESEKLNIRNTFLIFILLATTGLEYFYSSQNYILIGCIISGLYFIKYKKNFNGNFLFVIVLFLLVEIFQYLLLGGFNVRTFSGTYIRLFFAYAVVTLTGYGFFKYYVRVMYIISVISLVFYFFSFIPGVQDLYGYLGSLIPNPFVSEGFYKGSPNIIIYTFHEVLFSSYRNSGPFWEPGGFAVFLLIALLYNHLIDKNIRSKTNLVFILSLATTLSTTGYLAFFVFIFYYNFDLIKKNLLYALVFIGMLFTSFYLYENADFLKNKIFSNIDIASETTTSRFGSALADIESFKKSPIVGLGRAGAKEGFKSSSEFTEDNHRNNGVFDLLSKYGLPLTLIYFIYIYKTFHSVNLKFKISKYYPATAFIIILLLGFSQGLFMKPFFYSFFFLPTMLIKKPINR
jgi:O-antigen ligase/polysaccharide polymerase Wzy-like membrane protein